MIELPESLFLNPVLTALQTAHRRFAVASGEAARYPAAVAPFAAVASPTREALRDLRTLLAAGEFVWVAALGSLRPSEADLAAADLVLLTTIDVLQMGLPMQVEPPPLLSAILHLNCSCADEMVALTDLAFPGFFRPRTCEMGDYFGIRSGGKPGGELIAMGGERLVFPGYSEMSGLCTHPDHRGSGYAAHLLWRLARLHRRRGIASWLHVTATNYNAVNLYCKLGFQTVRSIKLHKLSLRDCPVNSDRL